METLLIIEPSPGALRNSEGAILELKDGRLALVYTQFTGGHRDESKARIVMRTSPDGGSTWSHDRVLISDEGKQNAMSVSLVRLPDGGILLFYLVKNDWDDCHVFVRRSHDDLRTLGPRRRVSSAEGYHVLNNDRVVQLSSGRLVVPTALHPCADGSASTWSENAFLKVYLSDDNGRSWRSASDVVSDVERREVVLQEPGVVELRDGRLLMWIRTDEGSQYECFSSDCGETWTKPRPGKLVSPKSPASIKRIPWSGDLLCLYNDHSGRHPFSTGLRTPLCAAVSSDEGRTWSPSVVVEDAADGWFCYTSMTFYRQQVLLSYCAGDRQIGGLNRLKLSKLPEGFISASH